MKAATAESLPSGSQIWAARTTARMAAPSGTPTRCLQFESRRLLHTPRIAIARTMGKTELRLERLTIDATCRDLLGPDRTRPQTAHMLAPMVETGDVERPRGHVGHVHQ